MEVVISIYFPDVSGYQPHINLTGALAVCAKATEGVGYVSDSYLSQRAEAARAGAYFLGYHFLHAGNAAGQAAYCHGVTGSTPIMLDVESTGSSNPQLGDITGFIDAYRAGGGTCFYVYLPQWYWAGNMGGPSLQPLINRGCLLWSATYQPYSDLDSGAGWRPYGGMSPSVWQYTSSMHFGGYTEVDFSAYRGTHPGDESPAATAATLLQFKSLVQTGKMPAPPAPPTPLPPGQFRPPEGLVTWGVTSTGAKTSWRVTPGAANYRLRAWLNGTNTIVDDHSVTSLSTNIGNGALHPSTDYAYHIASVAPDGTIGPYSPTAYFTTKAS